MSPSQTRGEFFQTHSIFIHHLCLNQCNLSIANFMHRAVKSNCTFQSTYAVTVYRSNDSNQPQLLFGKDVNNVRLTFYTSVLANKCKKQKTIAPSPPLHPPFKKRKKASDMGFNNEMNTDEVRG